MSPTPVRTMRPPHGESKYTEVLGVYLEPSAARSVRVGSLLRDPAGTVNFIVDDGYIERGPERPILSLAMHAISGDEDTVGRLRHRQDKTGSITALPPFFANLLPEGALRTVVEAQLPPDERHEFGMLRRLGGDLPGAGVVRDEHRPAAPVPGRRQRGSPADAGADIDQVRFSLPGTQMKFSMVESGTRLKLPAADQRGGIIAKMANRTCPDLPEIEFGAMTLAQAAGVATADARLVSVAAVEGVRESFMRPGKSVLAVSRFDREGDSRVHAESFAQVLGAVGDQKYSKVNVETVMRLAARFTPDPVATVLEMVRRLAVDLMLGNGERHLGNMAFVYRDGRTPTLSPAYDIVPTIFLRSSDTIALRFGGKQRFGQITIHDFERLGGYVEVSPRAIRREVSHTVERANDTWPKLLKALAWSRGIRTTLAAHWSKLALVEGQANPFGRA